MEKITIQAVILVLSLSTAHAEVLPSKPYALQKEERAQLQKLLTEAGHGEETTNIVATKYDNGSIEINIRFTPVSKKTYKEMTCVGVYYEKGLMKMSGTARSICYTGTDFYFDVGMEVSDVVIDKAVERYLNILKYKLYGFIKLGNIRSLCQGDDSYRLSIEIPEDERYAFTLILDKKDPTATKRIEIEPLPML